MSAAFTGRRGFVGSAFQDEAQQLFTGHLRGTSVRDTSTRLNAIILRRRQARQEVRQFLQRRKNSKSLQWNLPGNLAARTRGRPPDPTRGVRDRPSRVDVTDLAGRELVAHDRAAHTAG